MTTKQKGNLTEMQCLASFMKLGYNVSIPYGEDCKYDFIADINGKLIKIQVKTSSLATDAENVIVFSCRSTHKNSTGTANVRYSEDDVDFFATYWDNQCYLVPIRETSTTKRLRLEPPKNNHQILNDAKDYLLKKQIEKFIKEVSS